MNERSLSESCRIPQREHVAIRPVNDRREAVVRMGNTQATKPGTKPGVLQEK
jgi:hypothetical protein